MAQVFYKDGTPVPDDKVNEAIASGQAFAKADRVKVRDAAGNIGTIAASELGQGGHELLTDAEIERERIKSQRGTVGQQAITAAEGAARGATLGLSDVALTGVLGDEYRQGAKERAEENRKIAVTSEIGGAIAPALLSGGASAGAEGVALTGRAAKGASALSRIAELAPSALVSRGGRAIERGVARIVGEESASVLGRMAQRAAAVGASGAAEGALYGAGNAASQAALEGAPITAEKVLSGFGHGALFGGAVGAGLGGLGGAGSAAFEKIVGGSEGIRAGAKKLAAESALKATGFQGSDFRKLIGRKTGESAESRIADVGGELLNYTFESGPLKGQKLFTGAKKAEDFVDDLALAKEEVGQRLGATKQLVNDAGVAPDLNAYLKRVDDEVIAPLRASSSPTIQGQAKRVEEELGALKARAEAAELAATAPPMPVRLPGGGVEMRPMPAPAPPSFAELDQFRKDLRSVFQPPRPPGGGLPAPVPEHAAHLEKAERILAEELDAVVERHLAEAGLDVTEYARNKKTFGALADIEQVANKAAAQQLGNRIYSPSDYATGLGTAIGAMLTGNIGAVALGAGSAVAHKIVRERGRSVLAVMADSVAKMDGRIFDAAQSLAGLAAAPKRAAIVAYSAPDFDRVANAVRSFASNPQAASVALSKPIEQIAPVHPELAAQMQQTLGADYQYLASKLPATMTRAGSSLTPQLEKGRVSPTDQRKFMAIVSALENPAGVIERVAAGELPREQIEALKVRRPEIYNQMRTEAIKAFSVAKAPRGILERTRVSLAFDFNGDASLDPATLAAIQAGNRMAPDPEDQPATAGNPAQAPAGNKPMNPKEAESFATPSQKALGG